MLIIIMYIYINSDDNNITIIYTYVCVCDTYVQYKFCVNQYIFLCVSQVTGEGERSI